jgi:hypothetical protein
MGIESKGKSRGAKDGMKKKKKGGRKNTVVMFHKLVGGPLPEDRMESLLWNTNYHSQGGRNNFCGNEKISEPETLEKEEDGGVRRIGGAGRGGFRGESHKMSTETQVFSDILSKRITSPLLCDPNWKYNFDSLKNVTHSTATFSKISVSSSFPFSFDFLFSKKPNEWLSLVAHLVSRRLSCPHHYPLLTPSLLSSSLG